MAFRLCGRGTFLRELFITKHSTKLASSSGEGTRNEERVVLTDDGSTIVCWHPELYFPYEYSRPLPQETPKTEGVLKVQTSTQINVVFKEKAPEFIRQELQSITFTTKHRWFPRSRDKRAKKTAPDREYL